MKHYKIKKNKIRKKFLIPELNVIKKAKVPLLFLNKSKNKNESK